MTAAPEPDAVESGTNRRLLEIRNLETHFDTRDGVVKAVDGVTLSVDKGEVVGVVGESGCGKSVTALSIMGLVAHPGEVVAGEILLNGQNIAAMDKDAVRALRGEDISMIFQQPTSSLNPVQRAGLQIKEVFELHRDWSKDVEQEKVVEMLARVGIPDPESRSRAYPHELSGGMAQRIMIAMALACEPQLLIADEPTTALDVTIQAQILDLMRDLQTESDTSVILITHDLGVVAEMADRVAVMYAGEIVEEADVHTLFNSPLHPYTSGLIGSIPILGQLSDVLETIPGIVPSLIDLPSGCRFASRCVARVQNGLDICLEQEPQLLPVADGHNVRCWLYEEDSTDG
ncbi:MAG: ABC transporter ATP-binding protein [Acidimicrobiia bacterium]|nr:ABC transporter ATP-binding protein [Acidimicrobiia bacterium]MBT8247217.1 ABC transporter ATP-binding protein [Acidimicrobiia bacterium]NNF89697.1 ABC transporter ATP-binding protein [Acidimicrobiia bacterium]NNL96750.1 ABC transporter ATP-binding protein [Acidimicrobiia bacterium]